MSTNTLIPDLMAIDDLIAALQRAKAEGAKTVLLQVSDPTGGTARQGVPESVERDYSFADNDVYLIVGRYAQWELA